MSGPSNLGHSTGTEAGGGGPCKHCGAALAPWRYADYCVPCSWASAWDKDDTPLATTGVDAHHSAYVAAGARTPDPTLLPDYDADEPEPGTRLMVFDRDGWVTMHRVQARGAGRIDFGPRIPWPDGSTAARRHKHGGPA